VPFLRYHDATSGKEFRARPEDYDLADDTSLPLPVISELECNSLLAADPVDEISATDFFSAAGLKHMRLRQAVVALHK